MASSTKCAEAGSSKETTPESQDLSALIGRGKKHFVCDEVMEAVSCFGEASSLAAALYGQMAYECAEPYFRYGTALLELSRMENGVLGNALSGVKVEEEGSDDEFKEVEGPKISEIPEEERNKVRTDVQGAMEEKQDEGKEESGDSKKDEKEDEKMEEVEKKEEVEEKEEKDAEPKDAEDEPDKEKEDEEMEEDVEDEGEEAEDDAEEKDESSAQEETEKSDCAGSEAEENKGDEVPTLQLAWEMLELAKVIYKKQSMEEMKKEAQALEKLGEISLEQEQYSQAITDFKSCLKIVEEVYEPDDRALAEIHYHLGLANSLDSKFEQCIVHYKKSVETIQLKIKSLEEKIAKAEEGTKGKEKASDEDPCQADKKEIKELQALLPEIMAKIEDAEESKKNAPIVQMVKEGSTTDDVSSTSGAFDAGFGFGEKTVEKKADDSKAADDITHLVRRKRKSADEKTEESAKEETPAKKSKPAEETIKENVNGTHTEPAQNGATVVSNGADKPEPMTV